jgi:5'(3')-deoxyribonucleotidase
MMWIKKYFGEGPENPFYKKVVLTHNKHLNIGDFLIDDRAKNGASEFSGEWIQFGSEKFPDWDSVIEYLKNNYKKP